MVRTASVRPSSARGDDGLESPSDIAAFMEFVEAADADVLVKARERAGMEPNEEILIELELS